MTFHDRTCMYPVIIVIVITTNNNNNDNDNYNVNDTTTTTTTNNNNNNNNNKNNNREILSVISIYIKQKGNNISYSMVAASKGECREQLEYSEIDTSDGLKKYLTKYMTM